MRYGAKTILWRNWVYHCICIGKFTEDIMKPGQKIIKNWILIENTLDEVKYMGPLFTFVLDQFVEIFGEKSWKLNNVKSLMTLLDLVRC